MTTQEFIPMKEIKDDLVILKDGSVAVVVQTSAVNFDLLSINEQMAIIGSFAALLNSLSFSIQIVIRSKRLDISSYLGTLRVAEQNQRNPLLQMMMVKYRNFVSSIIRDNEVLDKQFYVCLSVSPLELGLGKSSEQNLQKAITLLIPRRDHIIRQLSRIGLKASQLNTEKLINLFYDIYNESVRLNFKAPDEQLPKTDIKPQPQISIPQAPLPKNPSPPPILNQQSPVNIPAPVNPASLQNIQSVNVAKIPTQQTVYQQRPSRNIPFVVEELPDEYNSL